MAFKKILVPVDFSVFSDKAVEYAIFIAKKFNASITLLHTVVMFEDDIDEEEHLQAYEKIIQKKENRRTTKIKSHRSTAETGGICVESVLIRGLSAADSILEYMNDKDFDLIVMGTHGRTGLMKWFAGSVAEKVVQLSKIPVLTVHKDLSEINIKKILVPVDFSKHSKIAVEKGLTIAREFNAKIEFLHVVEMEAHPEFYTFSFDSILKVNPELKPHILKNLKKLTGVKKDNISYVVLEGKVSKEIKEYADDNDVDLIIMPTRGMSDLEHFFLGSNTERVVRVAPCPVLTVRENKK